ncbi:hypothetical protein [Variovorax sp. EL159]|uniref:hypothetical protein n=1 Tax=Variovorax sp. EL159 TaxID=1566270 RepID=UPI00159FF705|nr:hypothetical protein [Variovorax sp. EL159]
MRIRNFYGFRWGGAKVDLKPGDQIEPGYDSNCGRGKRAVRVCLGIEAIED